MTNDDTVGCVWVGGGEPEIFISVIKQLMVEEITVIAIIQPR